MTRSEIIRMAQQSGWEMPINWDSTDGFSSRLERFAALVAAAECEACAKLCDDEATIEGVAQRCADAIRTRSNV